MRPIILVALALAVVGQAAALEVPPEWRVQLKELAWGKGGDFSADTASNKNKPNAIGRVEETQIVWNKQVYDVLGFKRGDGDTATVDFALGSLVLKRKSERQFEGRFKDLKGAEHWFRTGGWSW